METILIEKTGGENGDFLFSHALGTKEELDSLTEEIDFTSINMYGEFEFHHITSADNKDSISKNGLILPEGTYVSDLGKGIYVVEQGNEEAMSNLKDYVSEFFGEEEEAQLLLVSGTYKGPYSICIQGEGHEGYIVVKQNIPASNIEDVETMFVEDFLWDY